jgi:D-3-phosphoglycerate dehydrogenase
MEACLMDGAEANVLADDSPLKDIKNLLTTPRLGSHTQESRLRASWYVVHRMHEAIDAPADYQPSAPMDLALAGRAE